MQGSGSTYACKPLTHTTYLRGTGHAQPDGGRQPGQAEEQQHQPLLCTLPSYERGGGKRTVDIVGDGHAAWKALEETCRRHNATYQELCEKLAKPEVNQR